MSSVTTSMNQIRNNTSQVNFERGRENLGSDRLDKHAFMQLLMAKLQHQDPLNPVQDSDFMVQQAQLTQVEQMDQLVRFMQNQNVFNTGAQLVGKTVDVIDDFGQKITGKIDSVSFANGTAALSIDGKNYVIAQVDKIYGEGTAEN